MSKETIGLTIVYIVAMVVLCMDIFVWRMYWK
jgi:hypothetical protein